MDAHTKADSLALTDREGLAEQLRHVSSTLGQLIRVHGAQLKDWLSIAALEKAMAELNSAAGRLGVERVG